MPQLADKIRAKYPGQYDDLSDEQLEKSVLEKHPEYQDLTTGNNKINIPSTSISKESSVISNRGPEEIVAKPKEEDPTSPEERQSFLSKAYNAITKPIANIRSGKVKEATDEYAKEHPIIGGAGNFATDVLSGLSTPLNIATVAATGGASLAEKAGLSGIAKALSMGGRALSAPVAAHGGYELATGETGPEKVSGALELAGGLFGMRSHLPNIAEDIKSPINEPIQFNKPKLRINPDKTFTNLDTGEVIDQSGRSVNQPNLPPDLVPRGDETKFNISRGGEPPKIKVDEDKLFRNAANKFGMAKEMPNSAMEEFNKNEIVGRDRTTGHWEAGPGGLKDVDKMKRHQMPGSEPTAKFMFDWPGIGKQYNISGGPYDKSTVSASRLKELGIKIPTDETPAVKPPEKFGNRVLGPQFNPRKTTGMTGSEQIKSNLSKQVVENEPDYVQEILDYTKKGTPGLSISDMNPTITDKNRFKNLWEIAYRDSNGNPIAVARVMKHPDGTTLIRDFVGDKSKGLLYGKAVKAVKDKLQEMNALTSEDTISPDVVKMINKLDKSSSNEPPPPVKPPIKTGGNEPPIPPQEIGPIVDKQQSSKIKEAMMLPKGIMASYDLSAPGRQGLPLIGHKAWWTSWRDMVKSMGSEQAFQDVQKSIMDKPLFKDYGNGSFAKKAGLHLTDLTDLSKREEAVMSSWAEKIPGVRASNRAYTAYLNKLRADTFENLVNKAKILNEKSGEYNILEAQSIAKFINTATGRGSLGSLDKYATELNTIFFSPRLVASRLNMLNPMYYTQLTPFARKEAIKSLFAVAGAGTLVSQLGKLVGGTVESDPASSDFGKAKIGNTRIDPYAGFQQYIVLANRLAPNFSGTPLAWAGREKSTVSGKVTDLSHPKFGQSNRGDVIGRFTESKLNPALSLAWGIIKGKGINGQPYNIPEEVVQRFVPLFLQDLKTVATENPNLIPGYHDTGMSNTNPLRGTLAIPGAFGAGIQNYPSSIKR